MFKIKINFSNWQIIAVFLEVIIIIGLVYVYFLGFQLPEAFRPIKSECAEKETVSCGTDIGECQKGIKECVKGKWGRCKDAIEPVNEICADDKDNNCDGQIDEECEACITGKTKECGTDVGECKKGTQKCSDGKWSLCTGVISPINEIFGDGKDNDCDGQTDEGGECAIGQIKTCGSDVGICKKGIQRCVIGIWGLCTGSINPGNEICGDGKDNDCDGSIDEGCGECTNGQTRECGIDIGECKKGLESCINGKWGGECKGAVLPIKEICGDNKDNDCNNRIDEGCVCTPEQTKECGTDVGECKKGTQKCTNEGVWGLCTGSINPGNEICGDGKDNDCDGSIDCDDSDCATDSYCSASPKITEIKIIPEKPIKGEHAFISFTAREGEPGAGVEKVVITIPGYLTEEIPCNNKATCEHTEKITVPIWKESEGQNTVFSLKLEAIKGNKITEHETEVTLLPGIVPTGTDYPNNLFDKGLANFYYEGIFEPYIFEYTDLGGTPAIERYKINYNSHAWKGHEWDVVAWLYVLKDKGANDGSKMIISQYIPMTDEIFARELLAKYKIPIFAIQTRLPPADAFDGTPYQGESRTGEDEMVAFTEGKRKSIYNMYGINLSDWRIPTYQIAKTYIRAMLMAKKELKNMENLQGYNLNPDQFVLSGGSKRVIAMWPAVAYVNSNQSEFGFKVKSFIGNGASFVDAVGQGSNLGMYGRKQEMWGNAESGVDRIRINSQSDKKYVDPIYYLDKINDSGTHHVNVWGTSDGAANSGTNASKGFPLLHVYDYIPKLTSKQLIYSAGGEHNDVDVDYKKSAWHLGIQQAFFGRPKNEFTGNISESIVENGPGNLTLEIKLANLPMKQDYEIVNAKIYYIMELANPGLGEHKKYVFELSRPSAYNEVCPLTNSNGNQHCGANLEHPDGTTWTYTLSNRERDILIQQNKKFVYYIELEDKFKNSGCLLPGDACYSNAYRTSMARICYYLPQSPYFTCGGPYDLDDAW